MVNSPVDLIWSASFLLAAVEPCARWPFLMLMPQPPTHMARGRESEVERRLHTAGVVRDVARAGLELVQRDHVVVEAVAARGHRTVIQRERLRRDEGRDRPGVGWMHWSVKDFTAASMTLDAVRAIRAAAAAPSSCGSRRADARRARHRRRIEIDLRRGPAAYASSGVAAGEERLQRHGRGRRVAARAVVPQYALAVELAGSFHSRLVGLARSRSSSRLGNVLLAPTSLIVGSWSSICWPPVAAEPAQLRIQTVSVSGAGGSRREPAVVAAADLLNHARLIGLREVHDRVGSLVREVHVVVARELWGLAVGVVAAAATIAWP